MSIEDLMRRPVRTLAPDASCEDAARVMRDEGVGAVVVAEGERPRGLVTDRDLVVRVLAAGRRAREVSVAEVMSGEPIFLGESRSLDQVIATMRDLGIRRMPVVDAEGRLEGFLSLDDLVVRLADQLAGLASVVRKEIEGPLGAWGPRRGSG